MAYRFNFTGRKRVLEAEAKIHVIKDAQPLKVRLEQTFSTPTRHLYDENDIVMLEAIRRTRLRRCCLGTVGNLPVNATAEFPDFPDGKEVYYRLRIIDPVTHKLKGLAKTLKDADREENPTDLEPILPVKLSQPEDGLGNLFWLVRYDVETPVLIISRKKFNSYDSVKSPEFKAFVLPEVLREVLTHAFILSASVGFPEWAEKWNKFVTVNLGVRGGPDNPPDELEERYINDTRDWIDNAVHEFANYLNLSTISIPNLTVTEDGNE